MAQWRGSKELEEKLPPVFFNRDNSPDIGDGGITNTAADVHAIFAEQQAAYGRGERREVRKK